MLTLRLAHGLIAIAAVMLMGGCPPGSGGGYGGGPAYYPVQHPTYMQGSPHSVDLATPFLQGVAAGQGRGQVYAPAVAPDQKRAYVPAGASSPTLLGAQYWIEKNIGQGTIIQLNDGSLWETDSLDRLDAMLWLPMERITIVDNTSGITLYRLVNTDTGESVGAKKVSR